MFLFISCFIQSFLQYPAIDVRRSSESVSSRFALVWPIRMGLAVKKSCKLVGVSLPVSRSVSPALDEPSTWVRSPGAHKSIGSEWTLMQSDWFFRLMTLLYRSGRIDRSFDIMQTYSLITGQFVFDYLQSGGAPVGKWISRCDVTLTSAIKSRSAIAYD